MSKAIGNESSLRLTRHIESVPSGTDSSFNNGKGRGWIAELEGREYFPRDAHGLVDIGETYGPYLVDDPDIVPTQVTDEMRDEWIHQHLYFWEKFYIQRDAPAPTRDLVLMGFRRAGYNQLIMRPKQEQAAHDRYARVVSPPDPEAMSQQLVDFGHLDRLGASAVGRRIALAPEALPYLAPGTGLSNLAKRYSPREMATFFEQETERILEILSEPLVTDERMVTGAISRMARMINSERLQEEVARRTSIDPVHYPVRIPKLSTLYQLSNTMLGDIAVVRMADYRPALQTGVGSVESIR